MPIFIIDLSIFKGQEAQTKIFSEGHFCYEVMIIAEEIEPLIKYFYLKWRWDCKITPSTKPEIIIWEIEDNSPKIELKEAV